MENAEFEVIEPRAAALVESLRAFGYDLGSAVADLVDNCVAAQAANIWIDLRWAGSESTICITDDGRGMDEDTLRSAMRLGSRHPSDPRASDDLGRFGLGLKTASFAQCRCVTVCTKEVESPPILRRWDLDHLAKTDAWQVLLNVREGGDECLKRLDVLENGTCVIWQDLDRVPGASTDTSNRNRDIFNELCEKVEEHLALVFHRLLEGRGQISIFVNDRKVNPVDPFFIEDATQVLQVEHLKDSAGGTVLVEPFVMPHESKLTSSRTRKLAGDVRDWASRQGFYIYRQDRLLVAGSWLGFRGWRKDEHHKLARIRVSLTNASDEIWQIDVTKRKASPPENLRERLRRIGQITRLKARKVYSFRGARLALSSPNQANHVWEQIVKHGETDYIVNRDHPIVEGLICKGTPNASEVENLLRLIETSLPALLLLTANAIPTEFETKEASDELIADVKAMLSQAWHALREKGIAHKRAMQMLANWEPFNEFPELLDELNSAPPY